MVEDKWPKRRRFMYIVSTFCGVIICYILAAKLETAPAETATMFAFGTLASNVAGYVFGAAWENINLNQLNKQ